jgi:type I restriction enzyme R subunit
VIAEVFELQDYRILVAANKFQTSFDQPLLSTMFLDKVVNENYKK